MNVVQEFVRPGSGPFARDIDIERVKIVADVYIAALTQGLTKSVCTGIVENFVLMIDPQ